VPSPTDRPRGKWSFGFRYFGAPTEGVEVQLELDQRTEDLVLRVADSTDDLSAVPGYSPPNGRVLVEPEMVAPGSSPYELGRGSSARPPRLIWSS
jgi:hypothetical protein